MVAIAVVGQEIRRLEVCKERVQYARRKEIRRAEVKEEGGRRTREASRTDGGGTGQEAQECRPPWQAGSAAEAEAVLVRIVVRGVWRGWVQVKESLGLREGD